ncbi:MAG TPA: penicillin-binding protein activator [Methanocorpusculum sp.]|nr:penicillin-binding protein activator [Methanocorpusculum sp.]
MMKKQDHNPEHLMHKKFFGGKVLTGILLAIFLLASLLFIAIVFQPVSTDDEIKIAVILPLSGPSAEAGLVYKKGIDIAVDKQRENGKNISIRYFDTEADPNKALDAFFTAVDNKIPAVLGPLTTAEAEVIAPYAEMYKETVITYATGSSLDDYVDYVFHFDPSNRNIGYAVVNIAKQINATNLSVVWAETSLGRSIYDTIDEFAEKQNISIISIPITTAEDVIAKVSKAGTSITLVAADTPEQLAEILTAQEQSNKTVNTLWLSSDTGFGNTIRDNYSTGNLLVLVPTVSTVDPRFLDNYKTRTNETFDISEGYLLYGYDSLETLVSAIPINRENIRSEDIAKNLRNYRYLGQTGPVVFDENLKRFPMYEIYTPDYGEWKKLDVSALLERFAMIVNPSETHE